MNNNHIAWFGRYEGYLRLMARGVSEDREQCHAQAARIFDLMLPKGAVVVPMPSHHGPAMQMLFVARALRKIRKDIAVANVLRCFPHESNRTQKEYVTPDPVEMYLAGMPKEVSLASAADGVFILDNVVCSGVTASSALKVLPNATVVALAYSQWR